MCIDLGLEKLNVNYLLGVDTKGPITPRCYTLNHSDLTGELFLSIGPEFDKEAISGFYTKIMRDEVLAEWSKEETGHYLNVYCHVSGGFVIGTAGMRFKIFRRELPLVLEAICKGDNDLFAANPKLENAPIFVHFKSNNKKYNKIENWGKPKDYRQICMQLNKTHVRNQMITYCARGVESGTAFENLPDGRGCPVCGVSKNQFEKME